ncbi:class I SAM-dependent methyltransferase [Halpernia sp.]|uniref:class I SAM-dependent methyltransferase n=1 Tax=Halpernia sp. TaxID=2782209 RepID=UPI003A8F8EF1
MKCKICKENSSKIFEKIVLLKYPSAYYQCTNCGFVQTDEPIWLEEAYGNAITSLDIGILNRNDFLKDEISKIIDCCFPEAKLFLDFAGGYGLFVRSMRDKGFNFYRQDIYCENLFAVNFDIEDIPQRKFDIVTAFEVFEHLENPLQEIENILKFSNHLIFSTDLVPQKTSDIENWVYIAQETGQHIAFYTEKSLIIIAEKFGKNYYHANNVHVFTTKTFSKSQINYAFKRKREHQLLFGSIKLKNKKFRIKRESYQEKDYHFIKKNLNSK